MATYKLLDFSDIVTAIMEELKIQSTDTVTKNRIKRHINMMYLDEVVPATRWYWLYGNTAVTHKAYYTGSTASVTPLSTTVTLATAPASTDGDSGSFLNYRFSIDQTNEIYTVTAHTALATTLTLDRPYNGTLNATANFKIWKDEIDMPTDFRESIDVWHDHSQSNMEARGLQAFRKISNAQPKAENRPAFYSTYDFKDPSVGTGETESDRFRVMKVFPAISQYSTIIHIDYIKDASPLELDGDEPLMPIEDRIVLFYGGLSLAWGAIGRNPEEAMRNRQLFESKLSRMMGKTQDTLDKPRVEPESTYVQTMRGKRIKGVARRGNDNSGGQSTYNAPSYLQNVTINGANITGNVTAASGITIDGVDIGVLDADFDAHIADTSDAHDASAISVIPTGSLSSTDVQDALTELQDNIDTNNALTDGKVYIGNASNQATEQSVSGDIAITNTGVTSISSGVIVNADVNASAAIAYSKLAALTSGNILVGSAGNVPTSTAVTGDVTISNAGVTAIASGVIVNADVNASAAIAHSKLASMGSGEVLIGSAGTVPTSTAVTGDVTISNAGVTAISSGVIVNADVNASAAIAYSKLAALTSAHILVGSAGNVATDVAVTGDVTISNAGVTAIASGVIVNADVNASAAIAYSKLAALTDSHILVGSAGNVATDVAVTGDVTISNAGVTAIASGVIVNADVNASAAIAYSKLALTGAVVNGDLAGSIAASKLVGSDIATVGTVTTGTWSASTIALNKGGTGQTTKAAAFDALSPLTTGGGLIYGGASGTGTELQNGTSGQVLTSAGGTAAPTWSTLASAAPKNHLINSNFDFWQRGTSQTISNTGSVYLADRWYVKNSLGTNGVITSSQATGTSDGAKYAQKLLITTAPTAAQTNGTELYQVLENLQSLELYNQTASFSVKVKAFGNVNQVGIQFYYATSEVKLTTAIGSEVLTTVNTAGFTTCTISGQALGTSMTTAGVVGVRIRITAVSSGNTYDLNNGFSVEQAMLNIGATIGTYNRCERSLAAELAASQRYYFKTYDLTVNPATSTTNGSRTLLQHASTVLVGGTHFPVEMRTAPTVAIFSPLGTSAKVWTLASDTDTGSSAAANNVGQTGFRYVGIGAVAAGPAYAFHFTADAEI